MNLIEYARSAPVKQSGPELVARMREVLPLDEIKDLTEDEAMRLCKALTWLCDLSLLLVEFHENTGEALDPSRSYVAPIVPGPAGPFIGTVLTRGDEPPDFSQLVHFGLGPEAAP